VAFFSFALKSPGQYLRLGHDHLLPHLFNVLSVSHHIIVLKLLTALLNKP